MLACRYRSQRAFSAHARATERAAKRRRPVRFVPFYVEGKRRRREQPARGRIMRLC
jgi:hypothetical protein